MTKLMIERIKKASSLIGKILCSAYYNIEDGGNITVDSNKITGYKVENEDLYIILENGEAVNETYINSNALEIEFFPYHKELVLTAHSTFENKAKKELLKIKEANEVYENVCNKIKISPYAKYLLNIISEYEKKNGIKFDINKFIESSCHKLKNENKDFEKFYETYKEVE